MAVAAFRPLRHRNFTLAWSSSFVSSIGTWMQTVAVGVFIVKTTHNTFWLGAVTMAAWLPAIVGAPLGGVVGDRRSRQRWIQMNNLIMALCATTLAVAAATHHLHPWLIVVLAAVEGVSSSASWSGWQSLLRDLVDDDDVAAAVSLGSFQFNAGRVIGPAIAGVALWLGSITACFAANAASFVVVLVAFSFVRSRPRVVTTTQVRIFRDWVQGARAAMANSACRHAIVVITVTAIIISPFIQLVPYAAKHVFHEARLGTAWLTGAQGVGAVLAAVILPSVIARSNRLVVLRGCAVALIAAVGLYGAAPTLATAVVAMVVVGAAYVGFLNGLSTSVQLHAPTQERSRVLSIYTLALSLSYPAGCVIQDALANVFGVRTVTVTSAVLAAGVAVTVLVVRPQVFTSMGAQPATA
jgi:MFS family permease